MKFEVSLAPAAHLVCRAMCDSDVVCFQAEAKARTIRYAVDSSNSTLQQAEGEKTAAPSRKEEKGRTAVVDAESVRASEALRRRASQQHAAPSCCA
eukprot:451183-Rhodomonas_salina.1